VNEYGLRRHRLNVHQINTDDPLERSFVCYICGRQFSEAYKLDAHLRRHTNDRRHACPFCEKRFFRRCQLDEHVVVHLGVRPYVCPTCRRTFYSRSNLRMHVMRHRRKSTCQPPAAQRGGNSDAGSAALDSGPVGGHRSTGECEASFGGDSAAAPKRRHRTTAHPDRRRRRPPPPTLTQFACADCGHLSPSYVGLNRHRRALGHGSAAMAYVCDLCEDDAAAAAAAFPTAFRLLAHRCRRHFAARPFVCGRCGRRFGSQRRANAHVLRRHAGDVRRYECPKCAAGVYYSAKLLRAHLLRHVVADPLELTSRRDRRPAAGAVADPAAAAARSEELACTDCGARFRGAASLRVHARDAHLLGGGRAARHRRCAACGKCFSTVGNLRRHELIHAGTRRFCCDLCGRAFTQSNTLKAHLRVHTGVRPFVCPVCGHACTQSSNLTNHMRTHNNTI